MDAKHAGLMQDYLHLQHEFADLKDRLQAAKLRKSVLSAEVRFLRRRLKKLKQNPSDIKGYDSSNIRNGSKPLSLFNKISRMDSVETRALDVQLDLNKSSTPNLVSALKSCGLRKKEEAFVSEMAGKRRISWQDQISLECS